MLRKISLSPVVASLLIFGCGQKHDSSSGNQPAPAAPAPTASESQPAPAAPAAPADTYDQNLGKEYAGLPPTVVIAVDDSGNSKMRSSSATGIASGDQAATAFDQGSGVKVAGEELDGDTSTQSWSTYVGSPDFKQYQPQVHSNQKQGYSYNYTYSQSYSQGGQTYYVYQRPSCAPMYCQGNTPAQVYPQTYVGQGQMMPGYAGYDAMLAVAFKTYGVYPTQDKDYAAVPLSKEKIDLGGRLFTDTLLSVKGDLACASCHVQSMGTSTTYSLPPEGAVIGGRSPSYGPKSLLPRNTPGLFNLGHIGFQSMFWDGRVARDPKQASGFLTPAGAETPAGLESALAAQALFPLIGPTEMGCGVAELSVLQQSESPTAKWNDIMQRVLSRPDYQAMFAAAFPEVTNHQYGIQHLVNAIAAFESVRWRADNSPFDRYLRGDITAMSEQQKRGASYFYGKARCATCHAGALQTDHAFHGVAVPQFGPGAGDGWNKAEDFGLGRVTNNPADRYKFKTPSLRNVALTGPWGHDGAWTSLRAFVDHYRDPKGWLMQWNPKQTILPQGYVMDGLMVGAWNDPQSRMNLLAANEAVPVPLNDDEVDAIMQFLLALTDNSVGMNDHAIVRH